MDPSFTHEFLGRFNSFNDAVVRRIEHRYDASGGQRTTLTISTQDMEADAGWCNVIVVIDKVSEMAFREGLSTRRVLSDGLTIAWLNGKVWCDLSPYASDPVTADDFRRSDFYVVGESFAWRAEQFGEG